MTSFFHFLFLNLFTHELYRLHRIHVKQETNLASINTKIPYSNAVVKRTRHKAVINWRHAERNNPAALKKSVIIRKTTMQNRYKCQFINSNNSIVLCYTYPIWRLSMRRKKWEKCHIEAPKCFLLLLKITYPYANKHIEHTNKELKEFKLGSFTLVAQEVTMCAYPFTGSFNFYITSTFFKTIYNNLE